MAEFDLIPSSYAQRRRVQRHARYLIAAALAAVILVGAAWAGLQALVVVKAREVARLQASDRVAAADRAREQQYRSRILAAKRLLATLHAVRGSDCVRVLVDAIDGAYIDGVWFDGLQLARQVRLPPPVVTRGPAAHAPAAAAPLPEVTRTAEIDGHAADYAVLAQFVRRLGEQPGIAAVRLIDTGMRTGANGGPLDARIALSIVARPGGEQ